MELIVIVWTLCPMALWGWTLTVCALLSEREAAEEAQEQARERSERRRREEAEERQLEADRVKVAEHRHHVEITAASARRVPTRAFGALLPRVYDEGEEPTLVSRRG